MENGLYSPASGVDGLSGDDLKTRCGAWLSINPQRSGESDQSYYDRYMAAMPECRQFARVPQADVETRRGACVTFLSTNLRNEGESYPDWRRAVLERRPECAFILPENPSAQMADFWRSTPPPAGTSGSGHGENFLTRQYAGIPVWGWGAIGVGVLGGGVLVYRSMSGKKRRKR